MEFVSESMPTPSCHASTIVELKGGDLMAAWFGGTREGAPDVGIWTSRRTAGGWSAPTQAIKEPDIAMYNPVLFHNGAGLLWLYYKFGSTPGSWAAARMSSQDEGITWTETEHLPAGLYFARFRAGREVRTATVVRVN